MKILPTLVLVSLVFLGTASPGMAITVGLDDNYPPYSFRNADGELQGMLVDLWRLWSLRTGQPVELRPLLWGQALLDLKAGRVDVLDTVFLTPARSSQYGFTQPYASVQTAIFHRAGIAGLRSIADLKGYLVGIKAGDASADALRHAATGALREYQDYEALIDAAAKGEVHVFCMDVPPAQFFLYAKGLSSQFRQAFVVSEDSFHRAVRKEDTATLETVSRGFGLISALEVDAIRDHWQGTLVPGGPSTAAILLGGAGILLVVGLLALLVVFLLRQAKKRSGQLAGAQARLVQSEAWGRAVVEALPDLLIIADANGVVVECKAPQTADEFRDVDRFLNRPLSSLLPSETAELLAQKLATLAANGGVALLEFALEIRGRNRTFDARIARLADGRYLGIVRDVTAHRQAWQDDLHRNKLESLAVLAGGLAHDFNNSLAVIQGFVSLARVQLGQPEKALGSLDKAVAATRRAAGLTAQLRVLAHGSEVHRKRLSVKELAEEAAGFALVGSNCLLSLEAGEGPWIVEADPDQLSQVFHNLVLNAVQATPRGGTVSLVFRRPTPDEVTVAVVDEGKGISPDELPRIFDPYFTTKPEGTGLGLSVVRAVIERHGGSLDVESRTGRGTVFTVHLAASSGDPEASVHDPSRFPDFAGQRVLLMEDEADLRDLLVQVTTSLGFAPTACRNGREALAAFEGAAAEGRPFGLVISDLLVPGDMGGRALISALRSHATPFRALAVTGFSTERNAEDFHNQGFDVIVGKPFTVDELKTRIVELMKSPWKTAPTS